MFTGIIRGVGQIAEQEAREGDVRLHIDTRGVDLGPVALGDSIAVDGVCLTAAALSDAGFTADVSRETLALTTLGDRMAGARVNLEPALRAGEPLGGHLVSGHVDGMGELVDRQADARSWRVWYRAPAELARYLARKGSITVDGVSLTVNGVDGDTFDVNLVPHTVDCTNLGDRAPGDRVNLEVDQVARYLERLLEVRG